MCYEGTRVLIVKAQEQETRFGKDAVMVVWIEYLFGVEVSATVDVVYLGRRQSAAAGIGITARR